MEKCKHLVAEKTGLCLHCGEKVLEPKPDQKSRETKLEELGDSRYEWRTCPKCDGRGKITYGEYLYGKAK